MGGPFDPYHRWLAIPPNDQPPNHYRLLGLELFEGDADVIESAADQRMAHLRTFQTGKHSNLSQKLLNEVAAARLCLLNPEKRAAYEKLLRQELCTKPADAPKPRAEEPADSQLADFAAQADRGPPTVRSQVAVRRKPAKLGLLLGAAAAGGLLILGLILWGGPSTTETALIVDWPEDQRKGATLQIDGKPFAVESSGPLQHRCGPGEHRIRAGRPGFEPFVETVTLEKGQTKTIRPVWQKAAEEGPPPSAPPVAGTDKTPPDTPAETPSDGTTSVAGPPTPPVESGDGSPQEKPGDEPPKVAVDPGVTDPQQPPTPVEQQRLPVPSADAQQQVAAQLEEVYKLSGLKTPQQRLQSAGDLFDLGKKSKENPAERFVLLRTAGELARDGGDAALMLKVIEAIAADYDVDQLSLKQDFLTKFAQAATSSQRIGSLVENSLPLVDQSLAEGRYDLAFQLIDAAYQACTRSAGKEHRKRVYDRRGEVQKLYQVWKKFQDALTTLKTAPDDAGANLIVAQWHCFRQGDWEQGLPHLAKVSDEALKSVAQQELESPPADSAAQIKLADAWWDLAQTAKGETKDALMLHAGTWYEKAQPKVTALFVKDKLTKRLEQIAKIERPAPKVAGGGPRPGKRPPRGKRVRPFDPATAQLLTALEGHLEYVRCVAFSPDSSVLASSSHDGTVRFWDVRTGQPRGILPRGPSAASVAFSPDGSLLAVGARDFQLSLWNTRTGARLAKLKGQVHVWSVAFHPRGGLLASAGNDEKDIVRIWDPATGTLRAALVGHVGDVNSVAFSPDGATLASGGRDAAVRLWDMATGRLRRTLGPHGDAVWSVAFSPDGSVVASSSSDLTVRLWDPRTGGLRRTLSGHSRLVGCLAFHPDGSLLASASDDHTVRIWDVLTGELRRVISGNNRGSVKTIAFSPDGSVLAFGGAAKTVELWGTDRRKEPPKEQPAKTTPPAETGTAGSTTASGKKTMTLPGNPEVTLEVKSSVRFIRQAKRGLPVRIFASGCNSHEIHLNGMPLMKCNRDKPTGGTAVLKAGNVLAVKLGDRFDVMSLWMMFQTQQGEYLFETSDKWNAYLPLDKQRWWDVRNIRPGAQKAKYAPNSREYVDLVKKAAQLAAPNHPRAQPIYSPLMGEEQYGDAYLYYVVTVEDLLPKTLRPQRQPTGGSRPPPAQTPTTGSPAPNSKLPLIPATAK